VVITGLPARYEIRGGKEAIHLEIMVSNRRGGRSGSKEGAGKGGDSREGRFL